MWQPTHIQVTVQRAKGLLTKGKNGTNNCFVTIGLGKEKYQTSVKEKADANVNWNEECELKIPDQGNRAELVLTCLHRNNLGIDEFLGQTTLPLNEMDVYDRPRSKWFKLESKPGKEKKNKERGELEVRIAFVVKSGSLTDLSKKEKHKSSIGQLATSVGGSLLSIGTIEKRKGIKKFAKSLGSKMHLHSKKKNKEGDDISVSGSFASLGTPTSSNGGSRRYGQRAGEADPGVISEDEDEFVFDNLSHKSSGSSLNLRTPSQHHAPPTQNYVPHNPSPLLGLNAKITSGGKKLSRFEVEDDVAIDPELEQIENDISVRARTLPPPSKPPRIQQDTEYDASPLPKTADKEKLDEWEKKLYGKNLEIGSSDSLKRRSWEPARVPLPTANEDGRVEVKDKVEMNEEKKEDNKTEQASELKNEVFETSSSDSEDEEEEVPEPFSKPAIAPPVINPPEQLVVLKNSNELKVDTTTNAKPTSRVSLLSPDVETKDFHEFNASFAKYEQRNRDKIFDMDTDNKWKSKSFIENETQLPKLPQPMPRNREKEQQEQEQQKRKAEEEQRRRQEEADAAAVAADAALKLQEEEQRQRAEEDARLEEELRLNEQRLREEEVALQEELRQQEEQRRREAKRHEEDQRILNFAKRSISHEDSDENRINGGEQLENKNHNLKNLSTSSTPEQSPKEPEAVDKHGRRLGKLKFLSKRDKKEDNYTTTPSPKTTERIIIGHERATTQAERRSEISAALAKKYEGKSREELMLIANGMENEALLQRQRVKELEDYLDNLLLRVMETHPKILQNPYSRTTSAKSG